MEERRKFKRYPTHITIKIESLFKQDYDKIDNVNEDIEVVDVSKSGIGFNSKHILPLNYYFNAKIIFDKERYFYSVLKIIRIIKLEERAFHYGCEFIGLADILSQSVEEYGDLLDRNALDV